MPKEQDQPVTAAAGERMIELRIRFWTDNIAERKGKVIPKHAWAAGVVMLDRNKTHNIKPLNPTPFSTLMELPGVMEKVLVKHGVHLHTYGRMKKYISHT